MAVSVDPEQSDLGLHCLPRLVCPKTYDHYGIKSQVCMNESKDREESNLKAYC